MSQNTVNAARYADNFAYEPVSSRERLVALALAASLVVANTALAPLARFHLGWVPAFLPIIITATFIGLVLTAAMLASQYRVGGHAPLAILACAFASFGALQIPYLLTFPGVFSPSGLLGAGPQTAAWLYVLSRAGFAALVLVYVLFESRVRRPLYGSGSYVAKITLLTLLFVLGTTVCVTLLHRFLPVLVLDGGIYSPLYPHVVIPTLLAFLLVPFGALLVATDLRARMHLWLGVILLSSILEVCAAGLLSGGRFTVGWYLARADIAIDATLFLILMHAQLASILGRSARSGRRAHSVYEFISFGHENLAQSNEEMLAFAKRDLDFEWAFLARIDADELSVESSSGDTPYLNLRRRPRELALMKEALAGNDLIARDIKADRPNGEGKVAYLSYAAMPIVVDGNTYGVIGFGSTKGRSRPLDDADKTFIRLVGVLAGSNIERGHQHRRLDKLAFFDALTGLPNRALLMDRLQQAISAAKRQGMVFSVHFLDVDRFKSINDTFGHAVGDDVLREVANRLSRLVRESDTVARYGGDEFVVLARGSTENLEGSTLNTRINAAFAEPISIAAGPLFVGVSSGTSSFPLDGADADTLLRCADEGLYRIKARRNASRSMIASELMTTIGSGIAVPAVAAPVRDTTERRLAVVSSASTNLAEPQFEFPPNVFAAMSHEIRTPINTIIGASELMLVSELTEDQLGLVRAVGQSGRALKSTIENIFDYSASRSLGPSSKMRDADVFSIVESAVGACATGVQKQSVALSAIIDPDLERVRTDPARLRQILIHLIDRALEFTDSGKVVVSVNLEAREQSSVTLAFKIDAFGPGAGADMKPEIAKLIFEPFQPLDSTETREHAGARLDLLVVSQLVDAMGGRLRFENSPGVGSHFSFTMRFECVEAKSAASTLRGASVLVVDDDPTAWEIAKRYLLAWGIEADVASEGAEALDILRERARAGKPYDVAIVDYVMLEMDGLELGARIKSAPEISDTQLILVTAYEELQGRQATRAGDFSSYLLKPIDPTEFFESLTKAVERARMAASRSKGAPPLKDHSGGEPFKRVLLVEDHPVSQRIGLQQLKKLGFDAFAVSDGQQAVEALAAQRYDLVFMDCQMPVMDGFAATRAIREIEEQTGHRSTIVAMTANALVEDRRKCLDAGMDDYLAKPVALADMQTVMRRWIWDLASEVEAVPVA